MPLPKPEPGLVISFSYLWRLEHEKGNDEGRKNRPCVIILAVETDGDATKVVVAPITHSPPTSPNLGIEIPFNVKSHLGLDDEKSWAIISEVNSFTWPGFDLRPIKGTSDKYDYGFLPPALFAKIKSNIFELIKQRRTKITPRT